MRAAHALAAPVASAAVPPARMTSIAVSAASGCDVATMAFWAWTVDRPARWKFLLPNCSLYRYFASACSRKRTSLAHSGRARQWVGIPAFPLSLPLVNQRDDAQSRRFLSVRATAGFPGV